MFLWAITLTSTAILYWIYDGYGRALFLMNGLRKVIRGPFAASFAEQADETLPSITILLTVHNEDSVIRQRIENMLLCEYPPERLSVVVASDGSSGSSPGISKILGWALLMAVCFTVQSRHSMCRHARVITGTTNCVCGIWNRSLGFWLSLPEPASLFVAASF